MICVAKIYSVLILLRNVLDLLQVHKYKDDSDDQKEEDTDVSDELSLRDIAGIEVLHDLLLLLRSVWRVIQIEWEAVKRRLYEHRLLVAESFESRDTVVSSLTGVAHTSKRQVCVDYLVNGLINNQ